MRERKDGLRKRSRGTTRRVVRLGAALAVLACLFAARGAAADVGGGSRAWSVAVLGGWTLLDPRLDDYQWDVRPRAGIGAEALVGAGRFAAGGRVWRTGTTQSLDLAGSGPTVHATSWELIGRARVASLAGVRVNACGSVGRLHLAYDPDRMTLDPGTGTPVIVDFDPIDEWIAGGGFALERSLAGPWTASLQLDGRVFGLEAAHRDGGSIEIGRESFGDWSARLGLAWSSGRR